MRLSDSALGRVPPDIARFAYDRAAQAVGIVHFGIGAFQTKIAKKRSLRYDFTDLPLETLEDIADKIRDLNRRVTAFHFSHLERRKYHFVRYDEKG